MSFGNSHEESVSVDTLIFGNSPKAVFFAATGDSGSAANYPATSPHVVAVGGTVLTHGAETGWSGSGGGCSGVFPQPDFQKGITLYPI